MKTSRTLGQLAFLILFGVVIYSCSKVGLKDLNTESCDTEFTAQAISCKVQRTVIYTFTSPENAEKITIQGDLKDFTGPDAIISISGGALVSNQWSLGTNRHISIEGDVTACEKIIITINWTATQPGGVITGPWSVTDSKGVALAAEIIPLECEGEK